MPGNRKNSLDDLAQSFLNTRPAVFDEFLNQPPNNPPSHTSAAQTPTVAAELSIANSPEKSNEPSGSNNLSNGSQSLSFGEKENPGHTNSQPPVQPPENCTQSKRGALSNNGKRKGNESYEGLFFGKSAPCKSDHNDLRVLLKGNHSRIISRLVMYAEHNNIRVSAQLILDNILRHHFEMYAPEIKQIDLALLRILQQQINP